MLNNRHVADDLHRLNHWDMPHDVDPLHHRHVPDNRLMDHARLQDRLSDRLADGDQHARCGHRGRVGDHMRAQAVGVAVHGNSAVGACRAMRVDRPAVDQADAQAGGPDMGHGGQIDGGAGGACTGTGAGTGTGRGDDRTA